MVVSDSSITQGHPQPHDNAKETRTTKKTRMRKPNEDEQNTTTTANNDGSSAAASSCLPPLFYTTDRTGTVAAPAPVIVVAANTSLFTTITTTPSTNTDNIAAGDDKNAADDDGADHNYNNTACSSDHDSAYRNNMNNTDVTDEIIFQSGLRLYQKEKLLIKTRGYERFQYKKFVEDKIVKRFSNNIITKERIKHILGEKSGSKLERKLKLLYPNNNEQAPVAAIAVDDNAPVAAIADDDNAPVADDDIAPCIRTSASSFEGLPIYDRLQYVSSLPNNDEIYETNIIDNTRRSTNRKNRYNENSKNDNNEHKDDPAKNTNTNNNNSSIATAISTIDDTTTTTSGNTFAVLDSCDAHSNTTSRVTTTTTNTNTTATNINTCGGGIVASSSNTVATADAIVDFIVNATNSGATATATTTDAGTTATATDAADIIDTDAATDAGTTADAIHTDTADTATDAGATADVTATDTKYCDTTGTTIIGANAAEDRTTNIQEEEEKKKEKDEDEKYCEQETTVNGNSHSNPLSSNNGKATENPDDAITTNTVTTSTSTASTRSITTVANSMTEEEKTGNDNDDDDDANDDNQGTPDVDTSKTITTTTTIGGDRNSSSSSSSNKNEDSGINTIIVNNNVYNKTVVGPIVTPVTTAASLMNGDDNNTSNDADTTSTNTTTNTGSSDNEHGINIGNNIKSYHCRSPQESKSISIIERNKMIALTQIINDNKVGEKVADIDQQSDQHTGKVLPVTTAKVRKNSNDDNIGDGVEDDSNVGICPITYVGIDNDNVNNDDVDANATRAVNAARTMGTDVASGNTSPSPSSGNYILTNSCIDGDDGDEVINDNTTVIVATFLDDKLGLKIGGGGTIPCEVGEKGRHQRPYCITGLTSDISAANRTKIQIGDELVSIDNNTVENMSAEKVSNIVATTARPMEIKFIRRRKNENNNSCITPPSDNDTSRCRRVATNSSTTTANNARSTPTTCVSDNQQQNQRDRRYTSSSIIFTTNKSCMHDINESTNGNNDIEENDIAINTSFPDNVSSCGTLPSLTSVNTMSGTNKNKQKYDHNGHITVTAVTSTTESSSSALKNNDEPNIDDQMRNLQQQQQEKKPDGGEVEDSLRTNEMIQEKKLKQVHKRSYLLWTGEERKKLARGIALYNKDYDKIFAFLETTRSYRSVKGYMSKNWKQLKCESNKCSKTDVIADNVDECRKSIEKEEDDEYCVYEKTKQHIDADAEPAKPTRCNPWSQKERRELVRAITEYGISDVRKLTSALKFRTIGSVKQYINRHYIALLYESKKHNRKAEIKDIIELDIDDDADNDEDVDADDTKCSASGKFWTSQDRKKLVKEIFRCGIKNTKRIATAMKSRSQSSVKNYIYKNFESLKRESEAYAEANATPEIIELSSSEDDEDNGNQRSATEIQANSFSTPRNKRKRNTSGGPINGGHSRHQNKKEKTARNEQQQKQTAHRHAAVTDTVVTPSSTIASTNESRKRCRTGKILCNSGKDKKEDDDVPPLPPFRSRGRAFHRIADISARSESKYCEPDDENHKNKGTVKAAKPSSVTPFRSRGRAFHSIADIPAKSESKYCEPDDENHKIEATMKSAKASSAVSHPPTRLSSRARMKTDRFIDHSVTSDNARNRIISLSPPQHAAIGKDKANDSIICISAKSSSSSSSLKLKNPKERGCTTVTTKTGSEKVRTEEESQEHQDNNTDIEEQKLIFPSRHELSRLLCTIIDVEQKSNALCVITFNQDDTNGGNDLGRYSRKESLHGLKMLQRWSHAHENKQFLELFHLNTGVFNVLDFMSIILQDINFLKSKHDNNTIDGEHLAISTVGANKANLRTNINCIKYASRIISRVCYKGQYEENAEIAIKMASTVLHDYRDDTDRNTGLDIILRFNDDFDPNDVTENEEGTSTIAPSIELNVIKETWSVLHHVTSFDDKILRKKQAIQVFDSGIAMIEKLISIGCCFHTPFTNNDGNNNDTQIGAVASDDDNDDPIPIILHEILCTFKNIVIDNLMTRKDFRGTNVVSKCIQIFKLKQNNVDYNHGNANGNNKRDEIIWNKLVADEFVVENALSFFDACDEKKLLSASSSSPSSLSSYLLQFCVISLRRLGLRNYKILDDALELVEGIIENKALPLPKIEETGVCTVLASIRSKPSEQINKDRKAKLAELINEIMRV